MKRVLIVVDMQNDFVSGALGTPEARAIEPAVAARIRSFDGEVFATLDTHGPDYLRTQEGKRLPVPHCLAGTAGHALTDGVRAALAERDMDDAAHLLQKDTFGARELPGRIAAALCGAPEEVVLAGVCTDICVISNALLVKAFFPEARVAVDAACCAGVTPKSHQTALDAMRACQIDVL